jgi:hypothetical protein
MNINTELYLEHMQERLSDAHSKHEDSVDQLVYYIENEMELFDEQREKLDELMQKVYATLGEIKFEII